MKKELRIQLFARLRELARTESILVTADVPVTVEQLTTTITNQYPELSGMLTRCIFAVNQNFATPSVVIQGTEEIAIIPPVSGGEYS